MVIKIDQYTPITEIRLVDDPRAHTTVEYNTHLPSARIGVEAHLAGNVRNLSVLIGQLVQHTGLDPVSFALERAMLALEGLPSVDTLEMGKKTNKKKSQLFARFRKLTTDW